jgi:nucleotide-binding universal stress UspA family protein
LLPRGAIAGAALLSPDGSGERGRRARRENRTARSAQHEGSECEAREREASGDGRDGDGRDDPVFPRHGAAFAVAHARHDLGVGRRWCCHRDVSTHDRRPAVVRRSDVVGVTHRRELQQRRGRNQQQTQTGARAHGWRKASGSSRPRNLRIDTRQVTPIPVVLDGADHTTAVPLEMVVFASRPGARLILQLAATTPFYGRPRRGGRITFTHRRQPPDHRRDARRLMDTRGMTTIVVCTDGSDLATDAARGGLAILRSADTVLVVAVAEAADPLLAFDGTGHAGPTMTPAEFNELRDAELHNAQTIVDSTVTELGLDNGVGRVIEGNPGPALVDLARDEHATAIVIGTRGRGGIRRALLGSVSDYVVRNAPCPVVVLNPDA